MERRELHDNRIDRRCLQRLGRQRHALDEPIVEVVGDNGFGQLGEIALEQRADGDGVVRREVGLTVGGCARMCECVLYSFAI